MGTRPPPVEASYCKNCPMTTCLPYRRVRLLYYTLDRLARVSPGPFGTDNDSRVRDNAHAVLFRVHGNEGFAVEVDQRLNAGREIRIEDGGGVGRQRCHDLRQFARWGAPRGALQGVSCSSRRRCPDRTQSCNDTVLCGPSSVGGRGTGGRGPAARGLTAPALLRHRYGGVSGESHLGDLKRFRLWHADAPWRARKQGYPRPRYSPSSPR